MSHVLVVGGTGMLRAASVALAGTHDALTVIARRPKRLAALQAELREGCAFTGAALDWHDADAVGRAVESAQAAQGPVDLAVCWIHGSAPDTPLVVAQAIAREEGPAAHYLHVVGSAAGDPAAVADERGARLRSVAGIQYRQAILGFVVEGTRARWLTNAEISAGVIAALSADDDPYVVGTVRPWHLRP